MKIDLNADLGEGCASDSALLQLVSSANIACGFHAGDAVLMQQCVREALKKASLLAHTRASRTGKISVEPRCSYRQRRSTPSAVSNWRAGGNRTRPWGELRHVKPHGMLYNQAAKEPPLADAIARAVRDADADLVLVGLAGSELIRAGQHYQLTTRQEVFADRGYQADGSLVPRSQPGALIESEEQALAQTLEMVQHNRVRSLSGEWAHVKAETVCLHGDGAHALDFARRLRAAFAGRNIDVSADLE